MEAAQTDKSGKSTLGWKVGEVEATRNLKKPTEQYKKSSRTSIISAQQDVQTGL